MVAGNSLGGYASLATAVKYPEAVKGVVLLNAAGRFEEVKAEAQAQVEAALPDNPVGQEAKGALREVGTSQSSATPSPRMSAPLDIRVQVPAHIKSMCLESMHPISTLLGYLLRLQSGAMCERADTLAVCLTVDAFSGHWCGARQLEHSHGSPASRAGCGQPGSVHIRQARRG